MKLFLCFVICFVLISLRVFAESNVAQFKDPRAAIGAAKSQNKLIVFFLSDSRNEKHEKIGKSLIEELNRMEEDFVFVASSNGSASDKALFSGRFKQDISKLPIAVVSNSTGEAMASYGGDKAIEFQRMLLKAHLKSGKVTNPLELAALKERIKNVEKRAEQVTDSFLAPIRDDLKKKKAALTPLRIWEKKDGTKVRAILIEALGTHGKFIDEKGDTFEIDFTTLSQSDVVYLQSVLSRLPK